VKMRHRKSLYQKNSKSDGVVFDQEWGAEFPHDAECVLCFSCAKISFIEEKKYFLTLTLLFGNCILQTKRTDTKDGKVIDFWNAPFFFPLTESVSLENCTLKLEAFAVDTHDDLVGAADILLNECSAKIANGEVASLQLKFQNQDREFFGMGVCFMVHNYPEPICQAFPGVSPFFKSNLCEFQVGRFIDENCEKNLRIQISHPAFGTITSSISETFKWNETFQLANIHESAIGGEFLVEILTEENQTIKKFLLPTDHLFCDVQYNIEYEWSDKDRFTFFFVGLETNSPNTDILNLNPEILSVQMDLSLIEFSNDFFEMHVFLCNDYKEYQNNLKRCRVPLSAWPHYPVCDIFCSMNDEQVATHLQHDAIPLHRRLLKFQEAGNVQTQLYVQKQNIEKPSQAFIIFELFHVACSVRQDFEFVGHFAIPFIYNAKENHYFINSEIVELVSADEAYSKAKLQCTYRVSNNEKLKEISNLLSKSPKQEILSPSELISVHNIARSRQSSRKRSSQRYSRSQSLLEKNCVTLQTLHELQIPSLSRFRELTESVERSPSTQQIPADHPAFKKLTLELEDRNEGLKCLGIEVVHLRKQNAKLSEDNEEIKSQIQQLINSEQSSLQEIQNLSSDKLKRLLQKYAKAHKVEKHKRRELQSQVKKLNDQVGKLTREVCEFRESSVQQSLYIQKLQRKNSRISELENTILMQEEVISRLEELLDKSAKALRKITLQAPCETSKSLRDRSRSSTSSRNEAFKMNDVPVDPSQKIQHKKISNQENETNEKLKLENKDLRKRMGELENELENAKMRSEAINGELISNAANYGKQIGMLKLQLQSLEEASDFDNSDGSLDDFSVETDFSMTITETLEENTSVSK